ncbi:hypothetical protein FANTH_8660 [Fusarium anthophilum]|uniref:Uncharacterized protein n=1 Tax=Fusarium anthophilum TaxID=48485 RepID=A0A8H5E093_9HYPO|nr:hypothetical protein FANTH_8660 [Fusarium anthophilum]
MADKGHLETDRIENRTPHGLPDNVPRIAPKLLTDVESEDDHSESDEEHSQEDKSGEDEPKNDRIKKKVRFAEDTHKKHSRKKESHKSESSKRHSHNKEYASSQNSFHSRNPLSDTVLIYIEQEHRGGQPITSKSDMTTRGPEEMSETVSQNKLGLQDKPEIDQSGSTDETKAKTGKKVRFKDDPPKMDSKDKKSRNNDNRTECAPTSYRFSLWDGETIKELNNCLSQAKASLKCVETKVKQLEDKKKALLKEQEDLQTEIKMHKKSIKKKRSLALFADLP